MVGFWNGWENGILMVSGWWGSLNRVGSKYPPYADRYGVKMHQRRGAKVSGCLFFVFFAHTEKQQRQHGGVGGCHG